ncbi:M23 family metallopeptidase [Zoogloea sp.]|uniref:M23 family metallopeptidase n=1 Tax=Zoogloea sp. TaxID=49181 RepID=UPI0031FE1BD1
MASSYLEELMATIFWPLQSNIIRQNSVSNTFGMVRKYASGAPKPHQGWDFSATVQTPVFSIAEGSVAFVRDKGDYGLQLCLEFDFDGTTLYAFYAHLYKVHVAEGDSIQANQLVAASGESGNAQGMAVADQHLHFEIRTKAYAGLGLADRLSPAHVFGRCPLHQVIAG